MRKIQKNKIIFIILLFIAIFFISNKSYAKSYTIDNMDIQATINQDGSVDINQTIIYDFNGDYNGIYLNIPYDLDDTEYDEFRTQNEILKDSLYNGNGVEIQEVSCENKIFSKVAMAYNGEEGVYTLSKNVGILTLKIYSPSNSEQKKFNVKYKIKDLAVKHNDYGELYYNFIGGGWETTIENLNIDIHLPNNDNLVDLYIWAHGPYDGFCEKISETQLNLSFQNVKPGEHVAARTLFPLSNIQECTKITNVDAIELVLEEEAKIADNLEAKKNFTLKIIGLAMVLFVYWFVLIMIYEKDKIFILRQINEDELFEKYNPLIAGCIQGNREILARDIIAVLLNLVNKKVIKLESIPVIDKRKNYNYILHKNIENENKMDIIEKFIYQWFFGIKSSRNLAERLEEMPKEENANEMFKKLNELSMKQLNDLGANKAKVPKILKILNNAIFVISLLLCFVHIQYNGFDVYSMQEINSNIITFLILLFPILLWILYIPLAILISARHTINKLVQKVNGQKIVSTSIAILLLWLVIIVVTGIFSSNKFILADEILLCVATLIIFTDNLMLKNEVTMIEDCSRLNSLKYKIENYSLMKDRDVEQIELWNEYLTYAIAFGISSKIIKKIKNLHLDNDLMNLANSDFYKDYIFYGYNSFYRYASLDRRFMSSYIKHSANITKGYAKAIAKSGGGGRSSGGGGFSGGGGRRTEEAEPFKARFIMINILSKNLIRL